MQALKNVVFVLGGPGAGKGTQCSYLVRDFRITHLSAGDLLRAEVESGSDNGTMIARMIQQGAIVPAEVTVRLLHKAMERSSDEFFLIDGFPRNRENADVWTSLTPANVRVRFCLFLDCPEDEQQRRILSRSAMSGRTDDNIESLRKRFATYRESTVPVLDAFGSEGKLRRVDAFRSADEVYREVCELMKRELGSEFAARS